MAASIGCLEDVRIVTVEGRRISMMRENEVLQLEKRGGSGCMFGIQTPYIAQIEKRNYCKP